MKNPAVANNEAAPGSIDSTAAAVYQYFLSSAFKFKHVLSPLSSSYRTKPVKARGGLEMSAVGAESRDHERTVKVADVCSCVSSSYLVVFLFWSCYHTRRALMAAQTFTPLKLERALKVGLTIAVNAPLGAKMELIGGTSVSARKQSYKRHSLSSCDFSMYSDRNDWFRILKFKTFLWIRKSHFNKFRISCCPLKNDGFWHNQKHDF